MECCGTPGHSHDDREGPARRRAQLQNLSTCKSGNRGGYQVEHRLARVAKESADASFRSAWENGPLQGCQMTEKLPTTASVPPSKEDMSLRATISAALAKQTSDPEAGNVLGNYRLLNPIGSGGFAVVWLASHIGTGAQAAVKVFTKSKFPENERTNAAVRFWEGQTALLKSNAVTSSVFCPVVR